MPLAPNLDVLDASWVQLGASWAQLGVSWVPLGLNLEPLVYPNVLTRCPGLGAFCDPKFVQDVQVGLCTPVCAAHPGLLGAKLGSVHSFVGSLGWGQVFTLVYTPAAFLDKKRRWRVGGSDFGVQIFALVYIPAFFLR